MNTVERATRWALLPIDSMLPTRARVDPVEERHGRLTTGLLLMAVLPMPVFFTSQLMFGQYQLAALSSTMFVWCCLLLATYRLTGRRTLVAHLLLVSGYIGVLATVLQTGGVISLVTPFLGVLAMMAFMLIGPRWGYAWAGIAVATIGALFFSATLGVEVPVVYPASDNLFGALISMSTVVLYSVGAVGFLQGVNALQRRELEEARANAEVANDAKSAFLANMSHELRTPMNGVLGLTEALVSEGGLTDHQASTLLTVLQSGRSLVSLLDDLLDLAKIESGHMVMEDAPTSIETLIDEVLHLVGTDADAIGVTLSAQVEPGVGWGLTDPSRLRQVLVNLVGNAVKFTERGEVSVRAHRDGDLVFVAVHDTGIGIPAEKVATLFDPFVQADPSTTRRFGGSGLGLSISQHLVGLLGGAIRVESAVGVGSTFTMHVRMPECAAPGRPQRSQEEPTDPPDTLADVSVLVAEDNPVNQMVAQRMLQRLGASVEVVANGNEALDAYAARQPDLILMDCHMPGMDGLEATRALRAQGSSVPIVAMTASTLPEERARALAAGMDAFLAKPVRIEQLSDTVSALVHREVSAG